MELPINWWILKLKCECGMEFFPTLAFNRNGRIKLEGHCPKCRIKQVQHRSMIKMIQDAMVSDINDFNKEEGDGND